MPHYRVSFSKNGRTGVRVLAAESEQQAVEALLIEGATIIGLEEVHVEIGNPESFSQPATNAPPARMSTWSAFWGFRTMLAPTMIRWSFVAATCALALGLIFLPIHFLYERRGIGSSEAELVRTLERAIPHIESLRKDLKRAEAEAARFETMPGHVQAATDARKKAELISRELRAARQSAGIGALETEAEALNAARADLKQRSTQSTKDLLQSIVTITVAWILFRLVCELAIVFFRMHEQLVSIDDRIERGR